MVTAAERVHQNFSSDFFSAVDRYEGPKTAKGLKDLALKTIDQLEFTSMDGDRGALNRQQAIYRNAIEKSFGNVLDANAKAYMEHIQGLPQGAELGYDITVKRPENSVDTMGDQIRATESALRGLGIQLQLEAALASGTPTADVGSPPIPNTPRGQIASSSPQR